MKQVIRLTESDLHRMIKESVRQVLSESKNDDYDINSAEYKRMYDNGSPKSFEKWKGYYHEGDEALTAKEIADYEALPDKVRHPNVDMDKMRNRIGRRDKYVNINGDKLANKKPNSILNAINAKKDREKEIKEIEEYNKEFAMDYMLWAMNKNKPQDEIIRAMRYIYSIGHKVQPYEISTEMDDDMKDADFENEYYD